jgi:hypothetical protein
MVELIRSTLWGPAVSRGSVIVTRKHKASEKTGRLATSRVKQTLSRLPEGLSSSCIRMIRRLRASNARVGEVVMLRAAIMDRQRARMAWQIGCILARHASGRWVFPRLPGIIRRLSATARHRASTSGRLPTFAWCMSPHQGSRSKVLRRRS